MDKIVTILGGFVLLALVVAGFGLLFSLPVMLLWDWLMPTIFGLKEITWLQAWGVLVLSGFLFKSSTSQK